MYKFANFVLIPHIPDPLFDQILILFLFDV